MLQISKEDYESVLFWLGSALNKKDILECHGSIGNAIENLKIK